MNFAKESIVELDLGLDDVNDKLTQSLELNKEIGDSITQQLSFETQNSKNLIEQNKVLKETAKLYKSLFELQKKQNQLNTEERKREKEHLNYTRKTLEWLTGWQGIKGFFNQKVPSLPGMITGIPGMMFGGLKTVAGLGLGAVGLGMAGYYGYGRLAENAGNLRFQGQGLAATPAELQTARAVYGNRVFNNPDEIFSRIQSLKTNIAEGGSEARLSRLLGKPTKELSNSEILQMLPEAVYRQAEKLAARDPSLSTFGLGGQRAYNLQDFDISEVQRILTLGRKGELGQLSAKYSKELKQFSTADSTYKSYQDTVTEMQVKEAEILDKLVMQFGKLNTQVQKLTETGGDLIQQFLKSDIVSSGIDTIGKGLDNFNDFLNSPKRKEQFENFFANIETVASKLSGLSDIIERILDPLGYEKKKGVFTPVGNFIESAKTGFNNSPILKPARNFVTELLMLGHNTKEAWQNSNINAIDPRKKLIYGLMGIRQNAIDTLSSGLSSTKEFLDTPMSKQKKEFLDTPISKQKQNIMKSVYKAFMLQKTVKLTPRQAKALTAEVGRENDFNPYYMFGIHKDKNSNTNIGMMSSQLDRNKKLFAYLQSKGLTLSNGKIQQSQEAMNAMAEYYMIEATTGQGIGGKSAARLRPFFENPDLPYQTQQKLLGQNFVKWAGWQNYVKDAKTGLSKAWNPAPHHAKRDRYRAELDELIPNDTYSPVTTTQQQPLINVKPVKVGVTVTLNNQSGTNPTAQVTAAAGQ